MIERIHQNRKLVLALLLSLFALIISLYMEFVNKLTPCTLCSWQRIIYLLIFSTSLLGICIEKKNLCLRLVTFSFLAVFLLSSYHFGVQTEIFQDPCKVPKVSTIDDFYSMLDTPPSCSTVSWRFLGVPLSGYGAIYGGFCLIIVFNFQKKDIKLSNLASQET